MLFDDTEPHDRSTYQQCELQKSNRLRVAYIPIKFAKVGNVVKLKDRDTWEDGWAVVSVGRVVNDEHIVSHRWALKHHRRASDI